MRVLLLDTTVLREYIRYSDIFVKFNFRQRTTCVGLFEKNNIILYSAFDATFGQNPRVSAFSGAIAPAPGFDI